MPLTLDSLKSEAEMRRCRGDILYFLTTYWFIQHPERGAILFDLREAQIATIQRWQGHRVSLTLKSRQIGFSTLAMGVAFHETFFFPDRFEPALSRTERDAAKLLKKLKYGYQRLPEWMKQLGPSQLTDTQSKVEWSNGSSVESLPATDPARGESAYRIWVDEWAFFPDPESAWSAIEPAADIGGRITALSTANGSGNLFHRMWVKAIERKADIHPIFYSWRAVPERDDAWYESKKRSMESWQLHQEYPSSPEEAFIKSGMTVFNVDELDLMPVCEPIRRGFLQPLDARGYSKAARFVDDELGPLRIWENPIKDGRRYVVGADVAEGLEHGDFSSAHVIDTKTGLVVAKWHGHIDPDVFGAETLWHLGWLYGCALVGIEANSVGLVTCIAIRDRQYPNIYFRTTNDERTRKRTRKIGWKTQVNTKPVLVAELARDLRFESAVDDQGNETLVLGQLELRDADTLAELKGFVREADGKTMHGSPWDDQTISLGIANQMRPFAFSGEWHNDWIDPFSGDGWEAFMAANEVDDEDFVIGAHARRR